MFAAILSFLAALLQAIIEIFRATKERETSEAARLQADRDELANALAKGDAMAISIAFEKLRQRTLVQVPQADRKDLE